MDSQTTQNGDQTNLIGMEITMGIIFVIMGKSATGKDTVFKRLIQSGLPLTTVVSYTTRPIRSGEQDGVEYHFVSEQQLNDWIAEDMIIERRAYNTVHGIWNYFTPKDGQLDPERADYLMILTLEGYEQLRRYYGAEHVVPLYIEIDDGIRLSRALNRELNQKHPRYTELCRRYLADEEDFCEENLTKLGIVKRYRNEDIDLCLREISATVRELVATAVK